MMLLLRFASKCTYDHRFKHSFYPKPFQIHLNKNNFLGVLVRISSYITLSSYIS